MNNPILYGVLMALVIPYALDLKHAFIRTLAIVTVLFAAALSGSRTTLVIVVFAVGAVRVYRWRTLWALPWLGVALIAAAITLGGVSATTADSRVAFLLERAGLKAAEGRSVSAAALGISLRHDVVIEAMREMMDEWGATAWIVGRGYYTAPSVGLRVAGWYGTVDNVTSACSMKGDSLG